MKLKNYILSMVAVSTLFSCSTDNEPIDPTKPNATLSILTDANSLTTKATDATITSLGVAVIYPDGQIMTGFGAPSNTDELLGTPVKGGKAQVVVFANLDATTVNGFAKISGGSLNGVLTTLRTLEKESITTTPDASNLSMSSKVYDVSIIEGKTNAMGFGATLSDGRINIHAEVIPLYRNVSRVLLSGLTLLKDTRYGTAVSLQLKSFFLANVKSETQLASANWSAADWGAVEVANPTEWWYGAHATITDAELYNTIMDGEQKDFLVSTLTPTVDLAGDESWKSLDSDHPYIGNTFYAYENTSTEKGKQTYLILCGDYTEIPIGGVDEVKYTDRYWAIAVNNMGTSSIEDGILGHKGIRRNHIYSIGLTITGRGSELPYTPDATINLNAEVVVNPWSELVDVPGDVE